jgi:hypothetical protein
VDWTKRDRERLDVVEIDYSRQERRVPRIEHIRNTEIRRRMDRFERASKKMEKQGLTDTEEEEHSKGDHKQEEKENDQNKCGYNRCKKI